MQSYTAGGPVAALETSTRTGSVALWHAGELSQRVLAQGAAHARDLLPSLADLIEERGLTGPRQLGAIIVGLGPGSYTGLRIGVATAQGLARGSGALLVGRPSLEAWAFEALREGECGSAVLDARGGEAYTARYEREASGVREVAAPRVLQLGELEQVLAQAGPLFGERSAFERAGLLPEHEDELEQHWREPAAPGARALLELSLPALERGELAGDGPLEPLYLRAFAAKLRSR